MLKLKWIPDLVLEEDLRSLNVTWNLATIRMTEIDIAKSKVNGARCAQSLLPAVIEDYAQAMKNGDAFPRLTVYRDLGSAYVILSGNQRRGAMQKLIDEKEIEKDPSIEVYVVDTSEKMELEAIARSGNVHHGERATKDDRIAHAVHMVRTYGMRSEDASQLFRVAVVTINQHVRAEQMRKNLGEYGINADTIPTGTLDVLTKVKDEKVVKKIGQLVAQHLPPAKDVMQTVNRIDRAKSEESRLQIVKDMEKSLAQAASQSRNKAKLKAAAPKAILRPRREKVMNCLTRLADFLDFNNSGEGFSSLAELQVTTAQDTKEVQKLWQRIAMRMAIILKHRK